MTRMGLIVLSVVATLAAPVAFAQNAPDNEDHRFTFHRTHDGHLRLDGHTGEVSLCLRRPSGWQCQAVPDERAALEAEIHRLQADNISLKRELLSRNLPLPSGIKAEPLDRGRDPRVVQVPSDAELNQIMTFMEKVWRRMVEMIVTTQRDMTKSP